MADEAPSTDVRTNPIELFSEQIKIPVYGLSFIGHIEKEIYFCGHVFSIRTLRPYEKAAVAVAVQPLRETIAEGEAWANAQVGLALTGIDYKTDFCDPIGPEINDHAKARYRYVTGPQGLHQTTLNYLYARYLELEQEALDGIRELQDLSERSRTSSQPSPDSLTAQGTSTDETDSVTEPLTTSS